MSKLLETVGRLNLMKGMSWDDAQEAHDLLNLKSAKLTDKYDIAIAYLIGIAQGKHEERQRRKGGAT